MTMTRPVRYFLVFCLVVWRPLAAEKFSQRVYFAPRTIDANRAMELTTWDEMIYRLRNSSAKMKIRSDFALTPFFQQSQHGAGIGRYFGIGNGKNSFYVGPYKQMLDSTGQPKAEVINSYLIHDAEDYNTSTLAGTVSFNARQEVYGMRLDYFQHIDDPIKHFYFKALLPIVQVRQNIGMSIPKADSTAVTISGKEYSLKDFFRGEVDVPASTGQENAQLPLKKAKIHGDRCKGGVGNLNLAVGYKAYQSLQNHIFINAGVILPTDDKDKGEYLFAPRCGNGGHVGFTLGVDGGIELWSCKEKKALVRVLASLDYRYLFEATEHRTPMLKRSFFNQLQEAGDGSLNYYYLGGYNGTNVLFPAANVFTQSLKVKPGNQGEALIAISFKCSSFVIDVGYNAFYKDQESVWLKHWDDDSFALVARNFDTTNTIIPTSDEVLNKRDVKASDFELKSVKNPSQISHKVFGGLGYSFMANPKCIPTIGAGASYEFISDNATMEAGAVWAKIGLSF